MARYIKTFRSFASRLAPLKMRFLGAGALGLCAVTLALCATLELAGAVCAFLSGVPGWYGAVYSVSLLACGFFTIGYVLRLVLCSAQGRLASVLLTEVLSRTVHSKHTGGKGGAGLAGACVLNENALRAACLWADVLPGIIIPAAYILGACATALFVNSAFGWVAALTVLLPGLLLYHSLHAGIEDSVVASNAEHAIASESFETVQRLGGIKENATEDETARGYGVFVNELSGSLISDAGVALNAAAKLAAGLAGLLAIFYSASLYKGGLGVEFSLCAPVFLIVSMSAAWFALAPRISELGGKFAALVNLESFFEAHPETESRKGRPLVLSGGKLKACGASLKCGDRAVFENLNIAFQPGTHTAVLGAAGAGKTALLKMLARMAEPDGGTVEIDGQNIYQVGVSSFRGKVAYVPDTPEIFTATLRDNIALSSQADDGWLKTCVGICGLDGVLPSGLDSEISPLAPFLTGSVRVKIALARALAVKPRILLIDSVFSLLSSANEAAIITAIKSKLPSVTIIAVAGRKTSVYLADAVCLLDGGGGAQLLPSEDVTENPVLLGRFFGSSRSAAQNRAGK